MFYRIGFRVCLVWWRWLSQESVNLDKHWEKSKNRNSISWQSINSKVLVTWFYRKQFLTIRIKPANAFACIRDLRCILYQSDDYLFRFVLHKRLVLKLKSTATRFVLSNSNTFNLNNINKKLLVCQQRQQQLLVPHHHHQQLENQQQQ